MKYFFILLVGLVLFGCNQNKNSTIYLNDKTINLEPSEEPPLIFELTIDEKTNYVFQNEIENFNGDFKNPKVQIKIHNWRQFPHGNLFFEYPSNYLFEYTKEKSSNTWTLSGNDFKIMYVKILSDLTAEKYTDNIREIIGSSNCTKSQISRNFNGIELNGFKLKVNLIENTYINYVYEINTNDRYSSFLVFQDFIDEDGRTSAESKKTFDKIDKTLSIKE